MEKPKLQWLYSLLTLPFFLIGCTHSVSEPEEKEIPEPCKALCGQAFLQGYNDHRGIFIYNRDHGDTGDLTGTDNKGNFVLPLPSDGRYTIFATYSLFLPDTAVVEVSDSTVKKPPRMTLIQYLKARIIPDATVFFISDSIRLYVEVTNLLDRLVYGPEIIRQDQIWLRDAQDTTKIFPRYHIPRSLPNSASFMPFETKIFRYAVSVRTFRPVPSPGRYQVWLADEFYVDPGNPYPPPIGGIFTFGDSFGPAKGWAVIQIQ